MYFGTKPFLHITDLDMIRDVTTRHFDKFVDHFVSKALYILLFIAFHVVAGSMRVHCMYICKISILPYVRMYLPNSIQLCMYVHMYLSVRLSISLSAVLSSTYVII